MTRRSLRRLLAVLALALAPPAAAADRLALDYDVYVGGFRLLGASTRLDLGPDGYAIRLDAALAGLPAVFGDWWAVVTADGAVAGDRVRPRRHRVARLHRGTVKTTDLRYRPDGTIDVALTPPSRDAPAAIAPALMAGAIDPLSGLVALIARASSGAACAGRLPAFDGKRRFDLVFADGGPTTLAPNRYSAYSGPARRCRMRLVPVAGDWDWDDPDGADAPRERVVDLWLAAPIAGGLPVPVRLEGDVWIGRFVVHLAGAALVDRRPAAAERPE